MIQSERFRFTRKAMLNLGMDVSLLEETQLKRLVNWKKPKGAFLKMKANWKATFNRIWLAAASHRTKTTHLPGQ